MVFNSAQFLLFLPLAALGYFAVPQKARRPWLLLGVYGPGFEASNFIYSQF